jgi:hypothetical protein
MLFVDIVLVLKVADRLSQFIYGLYFIQTGIILRFSGSAYC